MTDAPDGATMRGMSQASSDRVHGEIAPADVRQRIAALLATRSEREVVAVLGTTRQTLPRVLAGLPVRRGTLALIQAGLERADHG